MSDSRRGLGRGLSALLGESPAAPEDDTSWRADGSVMKMIAVASIYPNPAQPRRHFNEEAIEELAQSIREKGVLQPIIVRVYGDRYQIIAGERRWRAAQRAQLHQIPAITRTASDLETYEMAIIENVQRQELNPIEEAEAYQRLGNDFGHSQEALGRIVGKSRSHVANLLRLLDLPETVREMVVDGRLTMGHARALITAENPAEIAAEVVRRGLSVRDTEALVKRSKAPSRPKAPAGRVEADADTAALERQLSDLIGIKVVIAHATDGSGTVSLAYSSLDQLDMICQRLSGGPI